ncbi:hypothetical protein, partial [Brevibacillus agri]|uniref:hypothetical protein n=1 Tax=Brevibacillus agri TaxID=51101 RepID=UPI001EE55FC0
IPRPSIQEALFSFKAQISSLQEWLLTKRSFAMSVHFTLPNMTDDVIYKTLHLFHVVNRPPACSVTSRVRHLCVVRNEKGGMQR